MKNSTLKIDLEIYVVFVLLIAISVINAIYSVVNISRNQDLTSHIMTVDLPTIQAMENMNHLVTRSKMYSTNWVYLQSNKDDKEKLRQLQKNEYPELKNRFSLLEKKWDNEGYRAAMKKVFTEYDGLLLEQQKVMGMLVHFDDYNDAMKKFEASEIVENEIIPQSNAIIDELNKLIAQKNIEAEMAHSNMRASYRSLIWSMMGLGFLIIIVVLVAVFYLSKAMVLPLIKLKNHILSMGRGEIPEVEVSDKKNAVGLMSVAVKSLAENMKKTTAFANSIGDGNYQTVHEPLSENDELGNALIQMRESLFVAHQNQQLRTWRARGLAKISDALRSNSDNINGLCENLIRTLVTFLDVHQGGVYLLEEHAFNDVIHLRGCYSNGTYFNFKQELKKSEGLVGQSIDEGKVIWVNDAPIEISSSNNSSGGFVAAHVLIIPLMMHKKVYGAIELISYRSFREEELEFVQGIGEAIGTTLDSSKANIRTKELLSETQKQADILAEQEEKLRAVNDRLQLQKQLLQASEEQLRHSNDALSIKALQLEVQNSSLEDAREALVTKAKELEMASQYKSEFLANMSHELRTPLNSILILAKLIGENKSQSLSQKEVDFAKVIFKSGSDLLLLINDILDLSKIEAGKIELIEEEVNITSMQDDVVNLFTEYAREKKINFISEFKAGLPLSIQTDSVRVMQIIKNLISNALKFTPEHGTVKYAARLATTYGENISEKIRTSPRVIEFSVSDTGIGIEAEKQQSIFEAFQQADGGTSRKYGGTGLGLSICKMLADKLGGEIYLESKVGEGSIFSLYLPIEGSDFVLDQDFKTESFTIKSEDIIHDRNEVTQKVILLEKDIDLAQKIAANLGNENKIVEIISDAGHINNKYEGNIVVIYNSAFFDSGGLTIDDFARNNQIEKSNFKSYENEPTFDLDALSKPAVKDDLINQLKSEIIALGKERIKILVVEDDPLQSKMLCGSLKHNIANAEIFQAESPEAALETAINKQPNLVIVDLDLGGGIKDGIDLIAKFKKKLSFKPRVFIYSSAELSDLEWDDLKNNTDRILSKENVALPQLINEIKSFVLSKNDGNNLTSNSVNDKTA